MSTELPEGWVLAKVADLAQVGEQPVLTGPFGTNMGRGDFQSSGVPVLTIGCLTADGISLDKAVYVAATKAEELDRYRLRTDDMLFSRMASVGRAGLLPSVLEGALFNYHIMRLRLDHRLYEPALFVAYVRGAPAVRAFLDEANHGATRAGINTAQLLEMPVLVPPRNEQRRIVAKLDALNEKSARAKEALEAVPPLLEKLRQSILAAAFRGDLTKDWRAKNPNVEPASKLLERIRAERRRRWEEVELEKLKAKGKLPKDDRWKEKYEEPALVDTEGLPELPEGWCWATLEQMLQEPLANGRSVQTAEDGFPVLRLTAIRNGGVLLEEHKIGAWSSKEAAPFLVRGGDFLVMRGNGSLALVGRGGFVPPAPAPVAFPDTLIRARLDGSIDRQWFRALWDSPLARKAIEQVAKTTAGIHKVSQDDLNSIRLPVAPESEQRELGRRLSPALQRIETLRLSAGESGDRLSQLNAAFLAKAFRGELVPQDPSDEPAQVLVDRLHAEQSTESDRASSKKSAPKSGARTSIARSRRAEAS